MRSSAPLTAAAPLFRVAVGRNYSLHTGPAFIVAGALVLHPLLMLGLVAALVLPQCAPRALPVVHPLFNVANYTLSALAAWAAVATIGTDDDLGFALAGLAAALAFVTVNHSLLAVMLRLGRGHRFRESGLFSPSGLTIELVLAGMGVALGAIRELQPVAPPGAAGAARARATARSRRSRCSARARSASGRCSSPRRPR